MRKALVVTSRAQPVVTPVSLRRLSLSVPVSSYEAASLYCDRSTVSVVPCGELRRLLSFVRFARGSYGLREDLWDYRSTRGCHLRGKFDSCLSCCVPLQKPLRLHAYFRKRNLATILSLCDVVPGDVLYANYIHSSFGILPYMIVLDRVSQSVVISVRGTVGFKDLITDLLGNPVDAAGSLPSWVLREYRAESPNERVEESDLYAHAGILASTTAILTDLRVRDLIPATMRVRGAGDARPSSASRGAGGVHDVERMASAVARMQCLSEDDPVPQDLSGAHGAIQDALVSRGWSLVVTGHSLGAAVATMLSFHLYEQFRDLRCYAYNPPGGLLSLPLSRLSHRFCTSVVVGRDVISRLSFTNTARVVDDMVLALARCRAAKLRVSVSALLGNRRDPSKTQATFCGFEDIDPEVKDVLRRYIATSPLHSKGVDMREMYLPGRIVFLRPYDDPHDDRKEVWDAVWTDASDLVAEGILFSPSMLRHHKMSSLVDALESASSGEANLGSAPHASSYSGEGQTSRKEADELV